MSLDGNMHVDTHTHIYVCRLSRDTRDTLQINATYVDLYIPQKSFFYTALLGKYTHTWAGLCCKDAQDVFRYEHSCDTHIHLRVSTLLRYTRHSLDHCYVRRSVSSAKKLLLQGSFAEIYTHMG